jgi:Family of unknown function (DUF6262)
MPRNPSNPSNLSNRGNSTHQDARASMESMTGEHARVPGEDDSDAASDRDRDSSSPGRSDSTPAMHRRNVTGLRRHAQDKRREALRRVDQAIQDLLRRGDPVSFHRLAVLAGVSKSYLYTRRELRERIEALRQQQQAGRLDALAAGRRLDGRGEPSRSDAAKDVLLAAKERRIQVLEAENRRLQMELRVALGKLYAQA